MCRLICSGFSCAVGIAGESADIYMIDFMQRVCYGIFIHTEIHIADCKRSFSTHGEIAANCRAVGILYSSVYGVSTVVYSPRIDFCIFNGDVTGFAV